MPYRFRRKISDRVAEVTTPDGHTIRLPYTGSVPERGSIVQPQKDNCCCPIGLQFGSSPNRAIRTDPGPRRISQRDGRITTHHVIYRGVSFTSDNFPYNPELPKTYTVILQPTFFDYSASKYPLYGIGVVIFNVPGGPKVQKLSPVRFGKIAYQFEEQTFGTSYDGISNITYYEKFGWSIYGFFGFLSDYLYNPRTGIVSNTGVTIEEYVKNHEVKYPLSDNFYFHKYYIADSQVVNLDNIRDFHQNYYSGYSASFILNSIQPKTRFFIVDSIPGDLFIANYKHLEYVEIK